MHMLHAILVNKTNFMDDKAIRRVAAEETEHFYGPVFDWRTVDTAGRWEGEYPNSVLHVDQNTQQCTEMLKSILNMQEELVESAPNFSIQSLYSRETTSTSDWMGAWEMQRALELILGTYTWDSGFYDLEYGSARLSEERIDEVVNNAEKYAIVLFDCHN